MYIGNYRCNIQKINCLKILGTTWGKEDLEKYGRNNWNDLNALKLNI